MNRDVPPSWSNNANHESVGFDSDPGQPLLNVLKFIRNSPNAPSVDFNERTMEANYTTFTIHTSLAYESVKAEFVENLSIVVDPATGSIVDLHTRDEDVGATSTLRLGPQDIDLRGKTVLPGLVDAHTHIFLHSYK